MKNFKVCRQIHHYYLPEEDLEDHLIIYPPSKSLKAYEAFEIVLSPVPAGLEVSFFAVRTTRTWREKIYDLLGKEVEWL